MDALNVDPLSPLKFGAQYGRDYPNATDKEIEEAYNKYKDFYVKYHSDHLAAITDCYEEFLKTLGKQGKQTRLLGG